VICAIPTLLEEQQRIFRRLNTVCPPETIFSASTPVLRITELAAELHHPENMLGLHFLPPVLGTKLVEIVRGYATSEIRPIPPEKRLLKPSGKPALRSSNRQDL
jgi:3-hydroxybutyryl-CoA dehydrogenase